MTFDDRSTTDDVLEGIDLTGTEVLVTGASTGSGEETTRALAAHGAAVTMAVRDPARGDAAAERIRAAVPDAELTVMMLDLASLAERPAVRGRVPRATTTTSTCSSTMPASWRARRRRPSTGSSCRSAPTTWATSCSPSCCCRGSAPDSRVVVLSSAGHRFSDVDLDDPNFERTQYDPWVAYGRAKTANALFAVELDRRLRDRGAHAYSVHPGGIVTELGRHLTEETLRGSPTCPPISGSSGRRCRRARRRPCGPRPRPSSTRTAARTSRTAPWRRRTRTWTRARWREAVRGRSARAAALWDRTEEWIAAALTPRRPDAGRRRGPGAGGWSCASTGVRRAGWGMLAVPSQRPGIPVCSRVRAVHGVSTVTHGAPCAGAAVARRSGRGPRRTGGTCRWRTPGRCRTRGSPSCRTARRSRPSARAGTPSRTGRG